MKFFDKTISGCFTIPSGIVCTRIPIIDRVARLIPEVGVITTKSIGPVPREGNREPIFTQYAPGCFMNAVGLANPGADAFAGELESLSLPEDRFLLISIFGKDAVEFAQVARKLERFADGLELNLSCPHAKGYGMAIGQDREMVREITEAVKMAVSIPVIAKLTPNVPDISEIALAAVEGGADGLCAINAVGPGYFTVDGNPVLTNVKGGMSGRGILPIGLECIKRIVDTVDVPIIGCGGISSAADTRAYRDAGASIFGIGSALTGLSTDELAAYFRELATDMETDSNNAVRLLKSNENMTYHKYTLKENRRLADDLNILVFDKDLDIAPGQFIFTWVPGKGEKPFSVLDDSPLTLAVRTAGCFTSDLTGLDKGSTVYVRGPYGRPVTVPDGSTVVLVSGGCGIAALYAIARQASTTIAFVGARDKDHYFYLDELSNHSEVHVATDDGSFGFTGLVTELLQNRLAELEPNGPFLFFNCGPEPMIEAALKIESAYAPATRIFNAIDYVTHCGVGVCGSCSSPDGRRLCVDGPFLDTAQGVME